MFDWKQTRAVLMDRRKDRGGVAAIESDIDSCLYTRLEVENDALVGTMSAVKGCDPSHLPATVNCSALNASVTAANQSTSLGTAASVLMSNGVRHPAIFAFMTGVLGVFGPKKSFSSNSLSFGLRNFWNDQRGAIAVMTGLSATVLVGFAALAIDVGSWQVAQRSMQGAADAAAYSAGIAYNNGDGTSYVTQAKGITAAQGYVDGQNGVTVTVNQPPTSGGHTSSTSAIEVIIQKPQTRFFAGLFLSSDPTVSARAVATLSSPACILALNPTLRYAIQFSGGGNFNSPNCDIAANSNSASAINMSGSSTVTTPCVVAVGGVQATSGLALTKCAAPTTGAVATADPYASVPTPTHSGSCLQPVTSGNNLTFSPGYYCGNTLQFSGSQVATFQAGVYYVDGNFKFTGSATANGTGVTFFIASPNSVDFGGNRTANFTAPTSGTYSGIAFFGDRAGISSNNNTFNGGTATTITGAIYFPTQRVTFSGGSASGSGDCTQIVADNVTISGNAHFQSACNGDGMTEITVHSRSAGTVQLVE